MSRRVAAVLNLRWTAPPLPARESVVINWGKRDDGSDATSRSPPSPTLTTRATAPRPTAPPDRPLPSIRVTAQWLADQVLLLRPANYATMPLDAQRVSDAVLWSSVAMTTAVVLMFPVFLLFGSMMGAAMMAIAALQPIICITLLRRGHRTAAVIALITLLTLVLNALVFTNGGETSTATRWYVIAPCLLVTTLPSRHRVIGIAAIVMHQAALLWLFPRVDIPQVHNMGTTGLIVDTLLAVIIAALLGLALASTRRQMFDSMIRAENDLRTAMTPIRTEFFVVDRSRCLAVDASDRVQHWLGSAKQGQDAVDCARANFPEFAEQLGAAFAGLIRGDDTPESYFALLPREHSDGDDHYECSYGLWAPEEGAPWVYMVTTLKNVSETRKRETSAIRRQALAVYLRGIQTDAGRATQRFVIAQAHIHGLKAPMNAEQWTAWCDELHRLAKREELHTFARIVHNARNEGGEPAQTLARERVRAAWQHIRDVLDALQEQYEQQGVRASRGDYHTLLALIAQRAPIDAIARHTATWSTDPRAQGTTGRAARLAGATP